MSYFDNTTSYSGLSADYVAGTFTTNNNSSGDNLAYFVTRAGTGTSIKRIDAQINFTNNSVNWGNIQPPAGGSTTDFDAYSSRYRGSIYLAKAGTYTFYTQSDDASYLWIDGAALPANNTPTVASALVDNGGMHSAVEKTSATVRLSAGFHNVLLFFSENTGGNTFTFSYAGTAEDASIIAKQLVPNAILCAGKANLSPVAGNVLNAPAIPNSYARTSIAPLQGTDADGTVDNYIIAALPSASQGVLYVGATLLNAANFPGLQLTAAQAAQLQFAPAAGFTGNATFTFHAMDNTPQRSNEPATYTVSVAATTTISGTVFEDVNYGGGAGRNYSTANSSAVASGFASNAIGRSAAALELYDNATGLPVSGIPATATSGTSGAYAFAGVPAGSYTVRVVNATVTSVRPLAAGASAAGLLPVQTFANGDVNRVGGEVPEKQDAAANSGTQPLATLATGSATAQSIAAVAVASSPVAVASVDFGFSFDVVANTNDAGQGSLRQFIANSNALGGEGSLAQVYTSASGTATALATALETSIFMLPNGSAVAGLRAGQASRFAATAGGTAATIRLTSAALPAITGPATAIDGSTQTRSTGDSNAPVTTANAESTGPEVLLDINKLGVGITISGNNDQIVGLGIANATAANAQGILINNNAIRATIKSSTINDNRANITFSSSNVASAATITDNVIRNAIADNADGIELNGNNSNMTISNNQLLRNAGFGIDFIAGANTGNLITGNTFVGNGIATNTDQLSGIGLRSAGSNNNVISLNTFTANSGAGIVAKSGTAGNVFSRNSFSGNGTANKPGGLGLGIDLMAAATATNNGDGVSRNADGKTNASGANGLLNFPVFTQATVFNGNLLVTGYARAGALLEFFVASADPSNFGEGSTYLFNATEGAGADADQRTFSYSGTTGVPAGSPNSGAETGASAFSFSFPVTTAQATSLTSSKITATASVLSGTLVNGLAVGNTSEFSAVMAVADNKPLPVELAAFTVQVRNTDAVLNWRTASEKNNDHFEVERSFNGTDYAPIGQVKGQGNTTASTDYGLTDKGIANQATGPVYYRLRQVDTDGTATFSPVRTVAFSKPAAAAISVFPNPAAAETQLDLTGLPTGTYQVSLLDATGREVLRTTLTAGRAHTIGLKALASGTYTVLVRGQANGQPLTLTKRLVKE